jgi:AraC family transcriptional regulator
LFHEYVGESPAQFVRRIRLEMAEFRLTSTNDTIEKIGESCGYESASAFGRAFRRAYAMTPESYRLSHAGGDWPSPNRAGIHWTPYWDLDRDYTELERRWPFIFVLRSSVRIAAREHFGNYAHIGERYRELDADLPALSNDRRFFTIYWNNMWTHPTIEGMRAHIGFELRASESPPPGFEAFDLPGGRCVTYDRLVKRSERNEAWAWMTRHWPHSPLTFDEHQGRPLPWERALTAPISLLG